MRKRLVGGLLALTCAPGPTLAEDWPEWRGRGRAGVWSETGILERFPDQGLSVAWRTPLQAGYAGPAVAAGRVFVTDFARSAGTKGRERALGLDEESGRVLWTREWDADYGGMSYPNGPRATPTVDGDRVYVLEHVYGICSYGQLRCLSLKTGLRVWESMELMKEKARWASGFMVKNGDRYFINTDRGDLVIAKLQPRGYEEISRTAFIKPTSNPGNRRELGAVNWSHPAYANRHVIARNDEEIVSYSLAAAASR